MMRSLIHKRFLTFFICSIGFFVVGVSFFDPDVPWHLRHGSDILVSGLKELDQYSYTMPSFAYVNHSWLSSILFSLAFNSFGYGALAAICVAFAISGIIAVSGVPLWITPLVAASYLDSFGVRSHVVSFMLLGFLIAILKKNGLRQNSKLINYVPLLFLIWANAHGGFILGLVYIWGYFCVEVVFKRIRNNKKISLHFALVALASTVLTLVTPYGIGTWQEALRTINNPLLKQYVLEWQPMLRLTSFSAVFLAILFFMSTWYSKKYNWQNIFSLLLLIASLLSIRILPLFALSASFTIQDAYSMFLKSNKKRIDPIRFRQAMKILTAFTLTLFLCEVAINIWNRSKVSETFYPTEATAYLKAHSTVGNTFSILHWNNYILWQMPEKKVFVDGRMMVWEQKNVKGELDNAFKTYIDLILLKESYEKVFDEFCIDTVLWNKAVKSSNLLKNTTVTNITEKLDKNQWILRYEDEMSVIYQRKLPSKCQMALK